MKLSVLFAAVLALALGPLMVASCSCPSRNAQQKMCDTDNIVAGKVVRISSRTDQGARIIVYTIMSTTVYKGQTRVRSQFQLKTAAKSADCGVPSYKINENVVVAFANVGTRSMRQLSKCDFNKKVASLTAWEKTLLDRAKTGKLMCGACKMGSKTVANGWSGLAQDGCNTCRCSNGALACTMITCAPKSCTFSGRPVPHGWNGLTANGCKLCNCNNGKVKCEAKECERPCTMDGLVMFHGWSGLGPDGCNTCKCTNGIVSCTNKVCENTSKSCTMDGKTVKHGWSGTASDGCNTCSCNNGNLACTAMLCEPAKKSCDINGKIVAHGWSGLADDGCNSCTCDDGNAACTMMMCA